MYVLFENSFMSTILVKSVSKTADITRGGFSHFWHIVSFYGVLVKYEMITFEYINMMPIAAGKTGISFHKFIIPVYTSFLDI